MNTSADLTHLRKRREYIRSKARTKNIDNSPNLETIHSNVSTSRHRDSLPGQDRSTPSFRYHSSNGSQFSQSDDDSSEDSLHMPTRTSPQRISHSSQIRRSTTSSSGVVRQSKSRPHTSQSTSFQKGRYQTRDTSKNRIYLEKSAYNQLAKLELQSRPKRGENKRNSASSSRPTSSQGMNQPKTRNLSRASNYTYDGELRKELGLASREKANQQTHKSTRPKSTIGRPLSRLSSSESHRKEDSIRTDISDDYDKDRSYVPQKVSRHNTLPPRPAPTSSGSHGRYSGSRPTHLFKSFDLSNSMDSSSLKSTQDIEMTDGDIPDIVPSIVECRETGIGHGYQRYDVTLELFKETKTFKITLLSEFNREHWYKGDIASFHETLETTTNLQSPKKSGKREYSFEILLVAKFYKMGLLIQPQDDTLPQRPPQPLNPNSRSSHFHFSFSNDSFWLHTPSGAIILVRPP